MMSTPRSPGRTLSRSAVAMCALCGIFGAGVATSAQTASLDLLRRAADPNPALNSYTASAALSATLHVLVPVHKNYNGNVYYIKPKRKIEFQNVTGALSKFKDLATSTPTYEQAIAKYAITPLTDDGTTSQYTLVPKQQESRIKSVTVNVNDASALISRAEWQYTNGGTLVFDQSYMDVGKFHVPSKSDVSARFPGYSVDGTITFTNYHPNVSVSPAVFASP